MVNRIRSMRMRRDMTQAQLAEMCGVSRQAINTIERGRHDPSVSLAFRIARALEVPITELFTDEDE